MPQPGWYADPDGTPARLRWWDGTRWTDNVHGGAPLPTSEPRRRGPWPWVALGVAAGLVVAVGFGLGTGLFGRDGLSAAPAPAESPTQQSPAIRTPTARPAPATLPPVTQAPRASIPTRTPTPFPSIPATPPTVVPDDGCPGPTPKGTLSDGQLVLDTPAGWVQVDGLTWLGCAQAATSADQTASVTLGVSSLPADSLQDAAEYVWTIALLDAAIPHPLSQTSTPVTVAGLDGWMVSGTVGLRDSLDELTVVVVDAGRDDPSVVVTLAGTQDVEARASVEAILQTLRPA